jgi:proteasome lid subunit RPN8/RPN11
MWPFRRKQRREGRPEPSLARQRQEAMRAARTVRGAADADAPHVAIDPHRARGGAGGARRRKKYVPPPVPADLGTLPPEYRAPEGPAVWDWVKRVPGDYFVEGWFEQDPEGYEDYTRWPRGDPVRGAHSIRRHVLDLILEASKAQYPNEFGGMLRAEKGIIEELILTPGTESGATSAIFQFHLLPVDLSIVGTIHSHPSPVPYPSAADTALFERHGRLHIITGYPYGSGDWRAFDHRSHLVPLKVVP